MKKDPLDSTLTFLKGTTVALAGLYLISYVLIFYFRFRFPFSLEVAEDLSVDIVRRILSGQSLYVSPSLDYISPMYTPLYYYLAAFLTKWLGIGFMPLRLLSFVSSLGVFFFIYLIVKKETKSRMAGFLSSGFFAATFRISNGWFDLGRADSLLLLFLLAALYLLRFHVTTPGFMLAAFFMFLAFLTKQTALVVFVPLAFYCLFTDKRRAPFFIAPFAVAVISSTWLLNRVYNGWYWYYLFDLPSQHMIKRQALITFWTKDILGPLAVAFAFSLFYLGRFAMDFSKRHFHFYFFAALGMMGGAWVSRIHLGSWLNVLIPAYAVIGILFGLGAHCLYRLVSQTAVSAQKRFIELFFFLLCVVQFTSLYYSPREYMPTRHDTEKVQKLVERIEGIEGEVFAPFHTYPAFLAGKNIFAGGDWIWDIIRGRDGLMKTKLLEELRRAFQEKRFKAAILPVVTSLDGIEPPNLNCCWWETAGIDQYYLRKEVVLMNEMGPKRSGVRQRNVRLFVPKEEGV